MGNMEGNPLLRSGFSRRRLLSGAAVFGGTAAISMALPGNLRKALAEPAPTSFSPKEIKVVHRLGRHPGSLGDLGHRHVVEATLGKQPHRRGCDQLAGLPAVALPQALLTVQHQLPA